MLTYSMWGLWWLPPDTMHGSSHHHALSPSGWQETLEQSPKAGVAFPKELRAGASTYTTAGCGHLLLV